MSGTLYFKEPALTLPVHNTDFQPHNAFLLDGASNNGAVDASVTAATYEVDSTEGTTAFVVRELLVAIEDTGSIDVGQYGNGVTLTNGVLVELRDSVDALIRTLSAAPIVTNMDWAAHMAADHTLATFGSGANNLFIRVPFASHGEQGLLLAGGDKLVVTLNADFTGLVSHTFLAVGYAD
jgi:hypothetical protein